MISSTQAVAGWLQRHENVLPMSSRGCVSPSKMVQCSYSGVVRYICREDGAGGRLGICVCLFLVLMSCPLHYCVKGLGQSSPVPLALVCCFAGLAKVGLMDVTVRGAGPGDRGYIPL